MSWFTLTSSRLRACFGPPPLSALLVISSAIYENARCDIYKMERLRMSKKLNEIIK